MNYKRRIRIVNSTCKIYYNNIKKLIPDTLNDRKKYLAHTKEILESYEGEHQSFSYDDLVADLGEPVESADAWHLVANADSLRRGMKNKKIIFCSIVAAAVVLVGLIIFGVSDKKANVVYREPETQYDSEIDD